MSDLVERANVTGGDLVVRANVIGGCGIPRMEQQ